MPERTEERERIERELRRRREEFDKTHRSWSARSNSAPPVDLAPSEDVAQSERARVLRRIDDERTPVEETRLARSKRFRLPTELPGWLKAAAVAVFSTAVLPLAMAGADLIKARARLAEAQAEESAERAKAERRRREWMDDEARAIRQRLGALEALPVRGLEQRVLSLEAKATERERERPYREPR